MISKSTVITTRTARIWLGDDGILRAVISPGAEQKLSDAQENTRAILKVCKGVKRPVLIDGRNLKNMDRAYRKYVQKNVPELFTAGGFLVSSALSRVLGSFFLRVYKTPVPGRLFTSEEEAIKWLSEFTE